MTSRMIHQTEATRDKIINIAEELFIENGFADTQMKDIATATGMSRNTLYRYYQDKYDLGFAILVVVLTRKIGVYEGIIGNIKARHYSSIHEGLGVLMNAYSDLQYADDDRFIAEFDGYYAGSRIPTEFRDKLTQLLPDTVSQSLTDIVALGQTEGSIRNDIPAAYLAVTLFNAVPTFFRRMLLRRDALMEIEQDAIPQLTPVLIQLLLDGMKPSPQL
ncbi:MAG: TetR/AcrR family transcriptional regulator [Gammaproteobacteria bacterium]|nr:TetR/AcrR family transcriptional regulator [Gammaproteobacteria bacterium]MBU1468294.1 TetR/AcrR family transcriptional regulator [Gammaproteobacteria bacterium]MBU2020765.1 TetR/AcrR family transcriptional regulator [Gammaproteobacteria bacterium]MBU2319351.1 TetR/AcrR family transcriptional regulator [Gammaproteobacteria bacterium]MBU2411813.1 TetR/AcrR family transcriptional regulator [Gammaproteobacteria bacterium]